MESNVTIASSQGRTPQKLLHVCAFVTDQTGWAWSILGALLLDLRFILLFSPTVYIRHEIRLESSEPWGHITSHTHKEATGFQLGQGQLAFCGTNIHGSSDSF